VLGKHLDVAGCSYLGFVFVVEGLVELYCSDALTLFVKPATKIHYTIELRMRTMHGEAGTSTKLRARASYRSGRGPWRDRQFHR
jgi:hypothetical protein